MYPLLFGQPALPTIIIGASITLFSWCQNIGKNLSLFMQVITYLVAWRKGIIFAVFVSIYMYDSPGPAVYYDRV